MNLPLKTANDSDNTVEWPAHGRLKGSDALRWAVALIRDQTELWRAGHRRPVESYLATYPQLAAHTEIGLALAASEFVIRANRGELPLIGDYRRRFPQWAERLVGEIDFLRRHSNPVSAANFSSDDTMRAKRPERAADHSWPRFPGYEIEAELGRGGMAVVYQALQSGLNRTVALKVILAGALAGKSDRERMRREAEAVARLRHPNVVQIYDIGEHEGCLYLSLEYICGGSLDSRLTFHPLAPGEAAGLVRQLAGAIQAAHDVGIIHRDLKPANVLLDGDGTPKVTDFGLAKQRDETFQLTATGTAAGTPSYMAPEQVLPEPEKIGPATDVYGLGCILYECLTGRPPFAGPTTLETMRQVVDDEVASVRRPQGAVPRDLETICLKCLEKDPAKRYASAQKLADDLTRFQAGEPIDARPSGPVDRAWRWARKHPVVPLLASTLGLMILVVAGLMAWSTYHAYRVAGHLRERELHLHGLRGTLLRLDQAQARYADLAAATGDPAWEDRHRNSAEEADRHRTDAARSAPELTDAAGLLSAGEEVTARERDAFELIRKGRAAVAWQLLQSDEHHRIREKYASAVGRFADRVDEEADAELREVQTEAFWALGSATALSGLIGLTIVTGWFIALNGRRPRRRAST